MKLGMVLLFAHICIVLQKRHHEVNKTSCNNISIN